MSKIATYVDTIGDGFNGDSLETLMACFAENAVFQDAQGKDHLGRPAIAAAFAPLFDGTLGKVHFDWTEAVVDEPASKAVVTWTMSFSREGAVVRIGGLDIFRFEDGLVVSKNTFSKAAAPLPE